MLSKSWRFNRVSWSSFNDSKCCSSDNIRVVRSSTQQIGHWMILRPIYLVKFNSIGYFYIPRSPNFKCLQYDLIVPNNSCFKWTKHRIQIKNAPLNVLTFVDFFLRAVIQKRFIQLFDKSLVTVLRLSMNIWSLSTLAFVHVALTSFPLFLLLLVRATPPPPLLLSQPATWSSSDDVTPTGTSSSCCCDECDPRG